MKLKVTFREYTLPEIDEQTGKSHRGDYMGSFTDYIERVTLAEVMENAAQYACEYSKENESDCRVWEIPIQVTPQGISSY